MMAASGAEKRPRPRAKLEASENQIDAVGTADPGRRGIDRSRQGRTADAADRTRRRPSATNSGASSSICSEELKRHARSARAAIGKPGGPPARGALEGMDAREFTVKSPPRVGDKPASSSRKTLFAVTFFGLMAVGVRAAVRLRPPPPVGRAGPDGPLQRVVHITPPPERRLERGRRSPAQRPHPPMGPRRTRADRHAAAGDDQPGRARREGESPPAGNGDADTDLLARGCSSGSATATGRVRLALPASRAASASTNSPLRTYRPASRRGSRSSR